MNIDRVLNEAPAKIAELAESAEESRFIWKSAEIQLAQLEAKLHLLTKAEFPEKTQSDLKATVEASDDLYAKRMEVLALESTYKKELIEVDKWVNAFTAARKKASLQIQELQSLHATVGEK